MGGRRTTRPGRRRDGRSPRQKQESTQEPVAPWSRCVLVASAPREAKRGPRRPMPRYRSDPQSWPHTASLWAARNVPSPRRAAISQGQEVGGLLRRCCRCAEVRARVSAPHQSSAVCHCARARIGHSCLVLGTDVAFEPPCWIATSVGQRSTYAAQITSSRPLAHERRRRRECPRPRCPTSPGGSPGPCAILVPQTRTLGRRRIGISLP